MFATLGRARRRISRYLPDSSVEHGGRSCTGWRGMIMTACAFAGVSCQEDRPLHRPRGGRDEDEQVHGEHHQPLELFDEQCTDAVRFLPLTIFRRAGFRLPLRAGEHGSSFVTKLWNASACRRVCCQWCDGRSLGSLILHSFQRDRPGVRPDAGGAAEFSEGDAPVYDFAWHPFRGLVRRDS